MEEKDEFQDLLMETKKALKDLRRIKKKIDPILFDIKDGTLVRVAPSRYNERGRKQPSDKNSTIQGMDADDEDNSESSDIDSDQTVSAKSKQAREIQRTITLERQNIEEKVQRANSRKSVSLITPDEAISLGKLKQEKVLEEPDMLVSRRDNKEERSDMHY